MKTNFSVTQFGKELDKSKYTWCEKTKTFSTTEDNLVLDFTHINGVTFKTGSDCTFVTNYNCTFKTSYNCTFKTSYNCTFDTGSDCTFVTSYNCTFKTSSNCLFVTGYGCTFDTNYGCTFKTSSNCVVVRRDVLEVIELQEGQIIKLNSWEVKGYTIIENTIRFKAETGQELEITKEKAKELGFNIK